MPKDSTGIETLERGNIYFLYVPRVHGLGEKTEASGIEDIERSYIVLSIQGNHLYRRIVIGRKRMPEIDASGGGEKLWGFIDIVERQPDKVQDEFEAKRYDTATRGERIRPEGRPAGEGIYRIVAHGNHNHLMYALELPDEPGPVQKALNIETEASYIFSVKNPEAGAPPGVGLQPEQKADFPERLLEKFRGRRFLPAEPELLNYEGTEVLLIGTREDPEQDLGVHLHPQAETEWTADIFRDLRMEKSQHPTKPLFTGEWE